MNFKLDFDFDPNFQREICKVVPLAGTRTGNTLTLSCGHVVQSFGNLNLIGSKVQCTICRDNKTQKQV